MNTNNNNVASLATPKKEVKPRKWKIKFTHYRPGVDPNVTPGTVCHIFKADLPIGHAPEAGGSADLYVHDEFNAKIGRKHSFKRALQNIPDKKSRAEIVEQFKIDFPGTLEAPDYIMKQTAKARRVYLTRALGGAIAQF